MVEPQQFGRGAGFAAGAASGSVQRKLRKMSRHPEEPRVFSQAKILLPIGLLMSLVMTPTMYFPIRDYVEGQTDDIFFDHHAGPGHVYGVFIHSSRTVPAIRGGSRQDLDAVWETILSGSTV